MARDFDLQLRQEVHGVFGAAIDFRMALLPAIALHFRNCDALDSDGRQRVADDVQLERLDDGDDQLHCVSCSMAETGRKGGDPPPLHTDASNVVPSAGALGAGRCQTG
jgi:hypothetical protein